MDSGPRAVALRSAGMTAAVTYFFFFRSPIVSY